MSRRFTKINKTSRTKPNQNTAEYLHKAANDLLDIREYEQFV